MTGWPLLSPCLTLAGDFRDTDFTELLFLLAVVPPPFFHLPLLFRTLGWWWRCCCLLAPLDSPPGP